MLLRKRISNYIYSPRTLNEIALKVEKKELKLDAYELVKFIMVTVSPIIEEIEKENSKIWKTIK